MIDELNWLDEYSILMHRIAINQLLTIFALFS